MLKARIITALILIPIVIAGIFFLPPLSFVSMAMLLILMAGWEWSELAGITHYAKKIIFLILLALSMVASVFIPLVIMIILGLIGWIIAMILLFIYPRASQVWGKSTWMRSLMGFLTLIPCWLGLIVLQGFSPTLLLFALILIWGVDSGAYFVGRKWGRHKLAPSISPGKSYEGLLGGLIAATIITVIGFWVLEIPVERWLIFFIICLVGGGFITVIGDLFESMVKRQSQVKDSGRLLPGHGGILDRIDSMTTAIPFFALVFPYFFNS